MKKSLLLLIAALLAIGSVFFALQVTGGEEVEAGGGDNFV